MEKVITKRQKITVEKVVRTSFLVDISDVILGLIAAVLSGSVIMLAEVLEGTADLVASGLLYIGIVRSRKPRDKRHPFGYGREMYFWTMMAALVMLILTATASFYFGWHRFNHPQPIENLYFSYLVLALAAMTNGYSCSLSVQRILGRRPAREAIQAFFQSPLVETKATLVLDLMGTIASILGFFALVVFEISGDPRFDGLGAMVIGGFLSVLSVLLLLGVKDLLVGRSASVEIEDKIAKAALGVKGTLDVLDMRTMYIGPGKLLVNIEIHVKDGLNTDQIEVLIDRVKTKVKTKAPMVAHIQVEPETP